MEARTIREIQYEDLAAAEELLSYTWADTYASFLSDHIIQKVTELWHNPELLKKQISNPHVHFLIAEDDTGKIIGLSTAIENDEGNIVLGRLYVHPECQRRGVGADLLNQSIEQYPGAKKIHLEVEESDVKGVNFYKKMGFSVTDERFESIDGTHLKVLIMEKML